MIRSVLLLIGLGVAAGAPAEWSQPLQVRHEETLCLSYQAKLDGSYLVVRAAIEPGWHTFAMDNKRRAEEKLAGKPSLGLDHPTEIGVTGGMEAVGPWYQTSPKDFSRPELRWFSWGFEKQAVFAAKVRRKAGASAQVAIRGQACTETTCKNIDVSFQIPAANAAGEPAEIHLKDLIPVR